MFAYMGTTSVRRVMLWTIISCQPWLGFQHPLHVYTSRSRDAVSHSPLHVTFLFFHAIRCFLHINFYLDEEIFFFISYIRIIRK